MWGWMLRLYLLLFLLMLQRLPSAARTASCFLTGPWLGLHWAGLSEAELHEGRWRRRTGILAKSEKVIMEGGQETERAGREGGQQDMADSRHRGPALPLPFRPQPSPAPSHVAMPASTSSSFSAVLSRPPSLSISLAFTHILAQPDRRTHIHSQR